MIERYPPCPHTQHGQNRRLPALRDELKQQIPRLTKDELRRIITAVEMFVISIDKEMMPELPPKSPRMRE